MFTWVSINAFWLGLLGVAVVGFPLTGKAFRQSLRYWLLLGVLIFLLALQVACGGGEDLTPTPRPGTPTGTFTITVTGASGSLQHSATATLIVQ